MLLFDWIIRKIIGTKNQRQIRKIEPLVTRIVELEGQLQAEPEEALRDRTAHWQEQFSAFHAPTVLAGVALRVADESLVDQSLQSIAYRFQALQSHFPELDVTLPGAEARQAADGQWLEKKEQDLAALRELLSSAPASADSSPALAAQKSDFQSQKETLAGRKSVLKEQEASLRTEAKDLRSQEYKLETKEKNLETENIALENKVKSCDVKERGLAGEEKSLAEEEKALAAKEKREAASGKESDLTDRRSTLESAQQALAAKRQELATERESHETKRGTVQAQIEAVRGEREAIRSKREAIEVQSEQDLRPIHTELEEVDGKTEEVLVKIDELDSRMERLMRVEWLNAKIQSLSAEIETRRSESSRLGSPAKESLEEKKERITRCREAYDAIVPRFIELEANILAEIMPEAYAVVKNAARRLCRRDRREIIVCDQPLKWEMIHFNVQLIGGVGLHRGMIAEMATGEGKTLVGTLPVYLNALTGRGVHVITVNDYLARRDSEWMGVLYRFLGLTIGCIQNDQYSDVRRDQYLADITYGTNSEFGFDYLRDNGMARRKEDQVQRGHYFAIIDEVDSVLIDEARTPLIISGPVATSTHQFDRYKPLVEQLVRRQNALCNRLMSETNDHYEKNEMEFGGRKMYQVRLGQPKNRGLLRAMEDSDKRRAQEKSELTFYQDTQKTELFALKEELYYTIDEKTHDADLSEMGRTFLNPDDPDAFVLPDLATLYADIDADTAMSDADRRQKKEELQQKLDFQAQRIHNINQLLRAYCLYEKDVEYVVKDNKIVIVDENTGREMPGRRWSDGLHQAVEAKEGVHIDHETQTLATITIQNYFRLYQKLAGMTGTAETDAAEFHDIYKLDVLRIPTNRPVRRKDSNDSIFKTRREKFQSVLRLIAEKHATGQPLLIGTASVESSETLSRMLRQQKIPHAVLNAKYHRQEAEIVARAGQRGAVTVSTNMAGRGTDIKLGEGVAELGGLFVLGTERHESRRVDRQLRGRCARQGDPGESKFFVSFEDDLMRNFGAADRMTRIMERFGMEEGQELEHRWLDTSVANAQKKVEQRNYVSRKHTLEYDDVMNQQREVIYTYRNDVLESPDPRLLLDEVLEKAVPTRVEEFVPREPTQGEPANYTGLLNWLNITFPIGLSATEASLETKDFDAICKMVIERIKRAYDLKTAGTPPELLEESERMIMLEAIDELWVEHLFGIDGVREGVRLRSYGQKDPLIEYKQEAYSMFEQLMSNINNKALGNLFTSATRLQAYLEHLRQSIIRGRTISNETAGPAPQPPPQSAPPPQAAPQNDNAVRINPEALKPMKREAPKQKPNDLCACGSGKKYKKCCGDPKKLRE